MGSKTFSGIRFYAYPMDHSPPHVHGFYAEIEVIVELILAEHGVRLAKREDAIRPPNAKRSDVKKVLREAELHFEELIQLWKEAHPWQM